MKKLTRNDLKHEGIWVSYVPARRAQLRSVCPRTPYLKLGKAIEVALPPGRDGMLGYEGELVVMVINVIDDMQLDVFLVGTHVGKAALLYGA